jgi:hypothetical protein
MHCCRVILDFSLLSPQLRVVATEYEFIGINPGNFATVVLVVIHMVVLSPYTEQTWR